MLSNEKVQEVISLLGQGLSRKEISRIADVSRKTIYRIERVYHCPKRRPLKHFPDCNSPVTSFVYQNCNTRQAGRSASRSLSHPREVREAGHLYLQGIDLKGEEWKRYLEMRNKVEREIAAGERTPLQYAKPSSD